MNYEELEKRLEYKFKNIMLLQTALTHSSYANEKRLGKHKDYERLEFLGDAVLELVSSNHLLTVYPESSEGDLTKTRASLVCEVALSKKALNLGLDRYILLGKGEAQNGGNQKTSILCDVMESVIGAIFKDSGFYEAESFIMQKVLYDAEKVKDLDYKTRLQEYIQNQEHELSYQLVREEGSDNDKTFYVSVSIHGKDYATGSGRTKKAAEQDAACKTLKLLKVHF